MKVVKKVRLLTKDSKGLFVNNENHEVLRNRAIVSDEVVNETENNYQDTGVLYIVDEKATKEWENAKKEKHYPKQETKKAVKKTEETKQD